MSHWACWSSGTNVFPQCSECSNVLCCNDADSSSGRKFATLFPPPSVGTSACDERRRITWKEGTRSGEATHPALNMLKIRVKDNQTVHENTLLYRKRTTFICLETRMLFVYSVLCALLPRRYKPMNPFHLTFPPDKPAWTSQVSVSVSVWPHKVRLDT